MLFSEALEIHPGLTAVMGSGGKTSLVCRLADELSPRASSSRPRRICGRSLPCRRASALLCPARPPSWERRAATANSVRRSRLGRALRARRLCARGGRRLLRAAAQGSPVPRAGPAAGGRAGHRRARADGAWPPHCRGCAPAGALCRTGRLHTGGYRHARRAARVLEAEHFTRGCCSIRPMPPTAQPCWPVCTARRRQPTKRRDRIMLVLIRGAGDLASGIALRLHHAHLSVVMTDLPQPTAIRRTVCFSQAIVYGSMTVEDVTARFCAAPENAAVIRLRERSLFWPIRRRSAARPCARISSSTPFWPRRISARASRTRPASSASAPASRRAKTAMPPWRPCAATRSAGHCITVLPCRTRTFPPHRRLCRRARAARPGGRHFCAGARDRCICPHGRHSRYGKRRAHALPDRRHAARHPAGRHPLSRAA